MKFPFSSRLPTLTKKQEEERRKKMSGVKITPSDRMVMIGTAFVWIFLPCVAVLLALALFSMWLFGVL